MFFWQLHPVFVLINNNLVQYNTHSAPERLIGVCPRANRISCFLLSKDEFPLKSTENAVAPARLMALSRKRKNTFYISERQDSSLHPSILIESYESFLQKRRNLRNRKNIKTNNNTMYT